MPLKHDLDLRPSDLQGLASRDAIVAFFTNLGYDTNARLTQTTEAMGLTAESIKRDIKHIERIADHEDGALQVYLLELKSITVANIQALARALRNRAGNFLWVLTSDYERLAFVLFEATLPAGGLTAGIGFRGAFLRPRVLHVNRRAPENVDLRVLRRFSYTEADADYQFQKLLSAYNIADWSEPYFNNRALFSDYYLNRRLRESAEWDESPARALRAFQELLINVRERVGQQSENVTRQIVIEPALRELGFDFKAGKASTSDAAEPDYLLHSGDPARPLAYCNTYVWDRNLDGADDQRDLHTPDENPGAVVVSLLERADAPPWAIVTNGKTWRLYSARTHSRATNYYELDLEEAANSLDPQLAFRYFWLFFRAQAFTAGDGGCFLDRLMEESARYARDLGERLKDRVFEQIFPRFAEGFIAQIRATEGPGIVLDDKRLDEIFHGTLTLLYRLLFLLYAEARDLLPVREVGGYHEWSLQTVKTEVAERGGTILDTAQGKLEQVYSATSTDIYDRLNRLFGVIDVGNATINVPLYNGGLFMTAPDVADTSPEARSARFLLSHAIPDRYLTQGLDRMARDLDPKTQALVAIDYKSLGVRQLGSIYEGLLEFKLRIAPEKMAVVKGKKTDEVIPLHEAESKKSRPKALLAKGAAYLENDRRERKATGSYYTPDYIVEYIVKHTVGPVLEAKCETLRPKLREAQRKYQEAVERQKSFKQRGMAGDDPEKVANTYRAVVDELFDLRVLDPAMGSGHFLVEAVDFITDGMLNFLNGFRWNPVTSELRRTRETILAEMERQGVIVDPARLTNVNLLKRHVLKRCVYGVDLNPMAVELAKVSLWLDCFTVGAPLSFLDHHLKCGNSLIGARISEVREAIEFKNDEQMGLFASSEFTGIMLATDLMRQVGELSDVTAEQVRQSRAEYRKATDALAPFKRIMDVYLSRWFGNEPTKGQTRLGLEPTVDFLRRPETKAWLDDPQSGAKHLPSEMKKVGETALQAQADKSFFHWELEFPEVFFASAGGARQVVELKENGGFDAVVGNPPYDELSEDTLGRAIDERQYLLSSPNYQPTQESGGRLNWYHFFMLKGVELLRSLGRSGYIVPMSWLGDSFTSGVRHWLIEHHRPIQIECFPQKDDPKRRVFLEAKLSTSIYILQKDRAQGEIAVRVHPGRDITDADFYSADISVLNMLNREMILIPPVTNDGWAILRKLTTSNTLGPLNTVAAEPTSGEIMFNEAMRPYLSEDASFDLVLRGGHVQRYELLESARQGTPVYLKTSEYLAASRSDSKAFDHRRTRVVYQEGSAIDAWRRLIATFIPEGYICGHKICYFINYQIEPLTLLAVFDSRLLNWYVEATSATNSLPAYLIGGLPFPIFTFRTDARRAELADKARKLYERCLAERSYTCVLGFVDHHLKQEPEESDVVHDLLAFLAEQMIELNKQKQTEQKRFLEWLETALNISPDKQGNTGLDALTGKTKLRGYLGDYQKDERHAELAEIMDVLHKNRTRLGVSLSDARLAARLEDEYRRSLEVLLPLKECLKHTDGLIDQVVYRLYGLTEEEVAVVEGRA